MTASLLNCLVFGFWQIILIWITAISAIHIYGKDSLQGGLILGLILSQFFFWLTHSLQESSLYQATTGYRFFGIHVSGTGDNPLSRKESLKRNFFRLFFSPLTLLFTLFWSGSYIDLTTCGLILFSFASIDCFLSGIVYGAPANWRISTCPGYVIPIFKQEMQDFKLYSLKTERGTIAIRIYNGITNTRGIIMAGGCGSGFGSPARSMYHDLAIALRESDTTVVWVAFRIPTNLFESIYDLRSVIAFLKEKKHKDVFLSGHSESGATVVCTAAFESIVKKIALISSQNACTEMVSELANTSLLIVHGEKDRIIPAKFAKDIYEKAKAPKKLVFLPGGHSLKESSRKLRRLVYNWFLFNSLDFND